MNEVVLVERLLERLTRAEQRCRDLERRQRRLVLGLFLILLIPLVAVLSGYSARNTRSCWRPQALSRSLNASRTMGSRWLPLIFLMTSSCRR